MPDEEVAPQPATEVVARQVARDRRDPHQRDQGDDVDLALAGHDAAEDHDGLPRGDEPDERPRLQERRGGDDRVGPGAEGVARVLQQLLDVGQLDEAGPVDRQADDGDDPADEQRRLELAPAQQEEQRQGDGRDEGAALHAAAPRPRAADGPRHLRAREALDRRAGGLGVVEQAEHGGAAAADERDVRAGAAQRLQAPGQHGAQRQRAGSSSLTHSAAGRSGRPPRRRPARAEPFRVARQAQAVRLAEDLGRPERAVVGDHEDGVGRGAGDPPQRLPRAGRQHPAGPHLMRHVGAEPGGERLQELGVPGAAGPGQQPQGRAGVGRAARHAARDRDALVDSDAHRRRLPAGGHAEALEHAADEVLAVDARADHLVARPLDVLQHETVGQGDRLHHGHELVAAVRPGRTEEQADVDLRGGAGAQPHGRPTASHSARSSSGASASARTPSGWPRATSAARTRSRSGPAAGRCSPPRAWPLARAPYPARASARAPCGADQTKGFRGDIEVFDESGNCYLEFRGVAFTYLAPVDPPEALKFCIAASFTAEPVEDSLKFWAERFGLSAEVQFAPYHQIFQQLLDENSAFRKNEGGINVILVNLEDWIAQDEPASLEFDRQKLEKSDALRCVLPNGLEIVHLNQSETDYLYQEIFRDECYLRHGIRIHDGDTVVDIGANIGLFSLFVLNRFPRARIYAFEPSPVVYELLKANCEAYGREVHVFQCGVSDHRKSAKFTFYDKSSVFSGFHSNAVEDKRAIEAVVRNILGAEADHDSSDALVQELTAKRLHRRTYPCQLTSLSEIIRQNQIERIHLLKIDAEKSESDIIQGIEEAHWPLIDQLVIEVHDRTGEAVKQLEQLLIGKGYNCAIEQEKLLENSGLFNIYATRPKAADASADTPSRLDRGLKRNSDEFLRCAGFFRGELPASGPALFLSSIFRVAGIASNSSRSGAGTPGKHPQDIERPWNQFASGSGTLPRAGLLRFGKPAIRSRALYPRRLRCHRNSCVRECFQTKKQTS